MTTTTAREKALPKNDILTDHQRAVAAKHFVGNVAEIARTVGTHPNRIFDAISNPDHKFAYSKTREALDKIICEHVPVHSFGPYIEAQNDRLTLNMIEAERTDDRSDLQSQIRDIWPALRFVDHLASNDPEGFLYLKIRVPVVAASARTALPDMSLPDGVAYAIKLLDEWQQWIMALSPLVRPKYIHLRVSARQHFALFTGKKAGLREILDDRELKQLLDINRDETERFDKWHLDSRLKVAARNLVHTASASQQWAICSRAWALLVRGWPEFKDLDYHEWSRMKPSEDPDLTYFRRMAKSQLQKRNTRQ